MDPVSIYKIASDNNRWLSVRQTAVAQNIANVNTPGYKSVDVEPFEATLDSTQLEMTRTRADHMKPESALPGNAEMREAQSWEVVHSGNNVSIEQQLLRASEVNGAYALNTGAVKVFHRMIMTSSRG